MKIKIKNFNGELPSYLTVGKEYDLYKQTIHGIEFNEVFSDSGRFIAVNLDKCDHLNGGSWEVVESE